MKEIIFFSNNKNKYSEIFNLFKDISIKILGLHNFNKIVPPNETGNTFKENAKIKAIYGLKSFKKPCFADDSGICIEALNNKPGINSKQFLKSFDDNLNAFKYIFQAVNKNKNNRAFFQTTICLSLDANNHFFFNGVVKGKVALHAKGKNGFAYDPIFIPNGYKSTYAEMTLDKKNLISHRFIAINKLKKYLSKLI